MSSFDTDNVKASGMTFLKERLEVGPDARTSFIERGLWSRFGALWLCDRCDRRVHVWNFMDRAFEVVSDWRAPGEFISADIAVLDVLRDPVCLILVDCANVPDALVRYARASGTPLPAMRISKDDLFVDTLLDFGHRGHLDSVVAGGLRTFMMRHYYHDTYALSVVDECGTGRFSLSLAYGEDSPRFNAPIPSVESFMSVGFAGVDCSDPLVLRPHLLGETRMSIEAMRRPVPVAGGSEGLGHGRGLLCGILRRATGR